MAIDIITEDKIQIIDQVENWKEAIIKASQPLLEQNYFNESYIDSMIKSVIDLGPYIVIAPEIAIAHARPNNDVNKVGLSLLKLNNHINFSENDHFASLIFVLSAKDSTSHLNILQKLAQVLSNQENINEMIESRSKEEILNILKRESL